MAVPGIVAGNLPGVLTLPSQIDGESICGNPSLVQGTFGVKGNFEVVTPDSCGGLAHYWRDNDVDKRLAWPPTASERTSELWTRSR